MQPEQDFMPALARHWAEENPPSGLAERIIRHARALPQHQPWPVRLLVATRLVFSEWSYGLPYKGAALAMVALLGVFSNPANVAQADTTTLLSAATTSWMEEL